MKPLCDDDELAALGLDRDALGPIEGLIKGPSEADEPTLAAPRSDSGRTGSAEEELDTLLDDVHADVDELGKSDDVAELITKEVEITRNIIESQYELARLEVAKRMRVRRRGDGFANAAKATIVWIASEVLDAIGLRAASKGWNTLRLAAADTVTFHIHSLPLRDLSVDQRFRPWRRRAALAAYLSRLRSAMSKRMEGVEHWDLSLPAKSRHVIATTDRSPLALLELDGWNVRVQAIYPWPAPATRQWIQDSGDTALASLVSERLPGGRWVELAVAGMLARLQMPSSGKQARDRLATLRAGGGVQPSVAIYSWMRSLSAVQRHLMEQHARAQASKLADRLRSFSGWMTAEADLSDPWSRLCHERDDLEGILVLLQECGGGRHLQSTLRDVDKCGRSVRFSLSANTTAVDERLRRVALCYPSAWWGSTGYHVQLV
jgi:hypothetical protein